MRRAGGQGILPFAGIILNSSGQHRRRKTKAVRKKKMKVCLLNDSFPPIIDGVANTVVNYANVLCGLEDHEVIVGTPRYPKVDYSQYPYPVVAYRSFNIASFVEGYRAGVFYPVRAVRKLADFRPDIIHTHCPVSATAVARILRNETDAPVVYTYHTKFDEDIAKAVKTKLLRATGAKILVDNISACDEVWAVSHGAGENLRSLGYKGDYRVVANGVDFPKGKATPEQVRSATEEYDLPAGVPLFLYVGRIMRYKGIPLTIEALRKLSLDGIDFRMVFIGGGVDAEELQKEAVSTGIPVDIRGADGSFTRENTDSRMPGRILFTGPIRDRTALRAWNTRADLFLFPSTYDTNGIVVREAAACGLASVLIEGSCAAEDITDGRNGYLIRESAEAMEKILMQTVGDLNSVHEVGDRAMDEIYLSWESSVRHAADLYGEIIEKKAAGGTSRRHEISDIPVALASSFNDLLKVFSSNGDEDEEGMEGNASIMRTFKKGFHVVTGGVFAGDGEEEDQ